MRFRTLVFLWFIAVFLPLFTLRLFQDEMLYIVTSMRAFKLQFLPRSSLVFLITSPLAAVSNVDVRVFLLRILTALITLADITLVYMLSRERFGERAAILGSLTFLLSFVTLRYGARYTLEPWGVLFVLLALYFLDRRSVISALSLGMAFAARETWLTLYPFFFLYIWKTRQERFWRFFLVSLIPLTLNFLFMIALWNSKNPLDYNSRILFSWGFLEVLKRSIFTWFQFFIAFPLTIVGFAFATYNEDDKKEPLLVILPPVLTLNVVFGFLLNGPFERYTFGPLALMSIYSGYGLIELYAIISRKLFIIGKMSLERWVALFLIVQLFTFNVAVINLSNIGAKGIQDYGYWYDREVFSILEEYGSQEDSFGGTPHPAILGFKNWTWADRNITKVLNMSPDWLVTFQSWVELDRGALISGAIEMWNFGPYVVIHARQEDAIKEYVTPTNFPLWERS